MSSASSWFFAKQVAQCLVEIFLVTALRRIHLPLERLAECGWRASDVSTCLGGLRRFGFRLSERRAVPEVFHDD